MTTSKPSQPPLFADGSEQERTLTTDGLFTTPTTDTSERTNRYAQGGTALAIQARSALFPTPRAIYGEHPGMSDPSHLTGAVLTSSPPAIPVNPSLSPGSAWARKMTGISGRSLRRWLPSSVLAGVFSRMCMDTSRWGSTRCYLTWKRSATPAGRSLFRLVPSAPPTAGIASGFSQSMWPTPNVAGGGNQCELTPHKVHYLRPSGQKAHLGLDQAVRMFPTPRAIYGEHPGMSDPRHLTGAVKMMPTPTARDWKDGSSVQNVPENGLLGRWSVNHSTTPGPGQKLSAAWVCRLMGYPDGWLDLDGDPDPT